MRPWVQRILRIATILFWAAVGVGAAWVALAAASNDRADRYADIEVIITDADELGFVNETMVLDQLDRATPGGIVQRRADELDLEALERALEDETFVGRVELFPAPHPDGLTLKALIEQKRPQYRIINSAGVHYYIAENGTVMPLSDTFTPRLVVGVGHVPRVDTVFNDPIAHRLDQTIRYIQADPFWEALIGQVYVARDGQLELIPRWHGHRVAIGDGTDLDTRFGKLRTFYEEALLRTDWHDYVLIDVRFEGQVVCKRTN